MAPLVEMLEERGLIEVYVDEQGREAYRLTEDGVRIGHMMAMVEGESAEAVLEALLQHVQFTAPSSGTYSVIATTYYGMDTPADQNRTGDYVIELRTAAAVAPSVTKAPSDPTSDAGSLSGTYYRQSQYGSYSSFTFYEDGRVLIRNGSDFESTYELREDYVAIFIVMADYVFFFDDVGCLHADDFGTYCPE